jgi:hypothetical protein
MDRVYHFRGLALHVPLEVLPPGITPVQQPSLDCKRGATSTSRRVVACTSAPVRSNQRPQRSPRADEAVLEGNR